MTKAEYRQYIASEDWQRRRKGFLSIHPWCERCDLPRWLAQIAYDQDLNVHHRCYSRLGREQATDVEIVCRRCHEIETWGRSDLHQVPSHNCPTCGATMYDMYSKVCEYCKGNEDGFGQAVYMFKCRKSQRALPTAEENSASD